MNKRAAAVIIENGKILLIHRFKNGREYFVVPGGTVEEGETVQQAAVREIKEETNLDIELGELIFLFERGIYVENGSTGKFDTAKGTVKEYFFSVKQFSGELGLYGPESEIQNEHNVYQLEWVEIEKLQSIHLVGSETREYLLAYFE